MKWRILQDTAKTVADVYFFFNDNEKDVRFILCFGKHTRCYVLAWKALLVYVCVCVSVCVQDGGSTDK